MLEDRETELRNMTYNPQYPIDMVFNAVSDYADFADLGNQPMTQCQTVAKAYLILNRKDVSKMISQKKTGAANATWPFLRIARTLPSGGSNI
jgi:hypothetical protein